MKKTKALFTATGNFSNIYFTFILLILAGHVKASKRNPNNHMLWEKNAKTSMHASK